MTSRLKFLRWDGWRWNRSTSMWYELADTLVPLLRAGMTVTEGLQEVHVGAATPRVRWLAGELAAALDRGETLAQFSDVAMPEMLRLFLVASETSGTLADSLIHWCQLTEQQRQWVQTLLRNCAYPGMLLVFIFILLTFLLLKVFPVFHNLYLLVHARPSYTLLAAESGLQVVVAASLLGLVAAVSAVVALAVLRVKRPATFERFLRRWPFARIVATYRARVLCLLLGAMVGAGIPIVDCLAVLMQSERSYWLQQLARRAHAELLRGRGLVEAFADGSHRLFLKGLETAQRTGDLAGALAKLEQVFAAMLLQQMGRGARLFEPLLMVFTGGVIAATMALMFLPMYDVIRQVSEGGM